MHVPVQSTAGTVPRKEQAIANAVACTEAAHSKCKLGDLRLGLCPQSRFLFDLSTISFVAACKLQHAGPNTLAAEWPMLKVTVCGPRASKATEDAFRSATGSQTSPTISSSHSIGAVSMSAVQPRRTTPCVCLPGGSSQSSHSTWWPCPLR